MASERLGRIRKTDQKLLTDLKTLDFATRFLRNGGAVPDSDKYAARWRRLVKLGYAEVTGFGWIYPKRGGMVGGDIYSITDAGRAIIAKEKADREADCARGGHRLGSEDKTWCWWCDAKGLSVEKEKTDGQ